MHMKSDTPVPSPCIEICVLNEEDVCTGCYRTAIEITDWTMMDNEKKAEVNALAAKRRKEDGAFL